MILRNDGTAKQFGPYFMAGWRVWSDLELPELCRCDDAGRPELHIDAAELPDSPESASFDLNEHGEAALRIPQVGLFTASRDGSRVRIGLYPDADPLLVRGFLFGSVLAALCYGKGMLPVHGSAVRIGDAAVIISGPSGAGKSTLAAALVQRGHVLLSDDLCPIDLQGERPLLWPSIARVKLMSDAVARLRLDKATIYVRGMQGLKGCFGVAALAGKESVTHPVPVAAACFLSPRAGNQSKLRRLSTQQSFVQLRGQVHRAEIGQKLGAGDAIFQQTCRLTSALPMYSVQRPDSLEGLDETAKLIEQIWTEERAAA